MAVKPVPKGCNTVAPYLVLQGEAQLIDFLKQAFDAEQNARLKDMCERAPPP